MNETLKDICSAVERVPTCSTPAAWPPPWLASASAVDPCPVPVRPAALQANEQPATVAVAPGGNAGEDDSEPAAPCPKCGSFDLWQTILGDWRCQHCDAATWRRSRSVLERAARLQQRYGKVAA